MSFHTVTALLNDQLQELHAAEEHLVKNLPTLLQGVSSVELRSLLDQHMEESARHEQALAEVLKKRSIPPHVGRCRVVDALLKRGKEIADTRGDSVVLDIGLLFILRSIETYERCAYESAKTIAESLELNEVVKILEANMRDEAVMEQSCTVLSEDMIDTLQPLTAIPVQQSAIKQAGGVAEA